MPTLDPAHASRIATAIDAVNMAAIAGLSPAVDCLAVLNAVAALQTDLREILETESRREMLHLAIG